MEVEAGDIFEQRGKRVHREKKHFKKRMLCVGPDFILKKVLWNQSFDTVSRYISRNGEPNAESSSDEDEDFVPVKELELDPFSMRSFHLPYSLNKRKRWMMERLMTEHIDDYQTEHLRVSGLTQIVTPLNTALEDFYLVNPYDIVESAVTTEFHTVENGEAVHKYGRNKHAHEYLQKPKPPKRRRGKRNVQVDKQDDESVDQQIEDEIEPYERRVHVAYTFVKSDTNKPRLNADKRISKTCSNDREDSFWEHLFRSWFDEGNKDLDEATRNKPSRTKCKNNYLMKTKNDCNEYFDVCLTTDCSDSEIDDCELPKPEERCLGEFIVVSHKKTKTTRRKLRKKKVIEDYRPLKLSIEREQDDNDVNSVDPQPEAASVELKSSPFYIENYKLDRIEECVSESADHRHPTIPSMFSTTNVTGDLIVIREDGVFLNPKPECVFEEYPLKTVLKVRNILSEMPTVAKVDVGECLKVMKPLEAENLALKLWIEENESEMNGERDQASRPEGCEICFSDEFQFALSSCGHFSCVDCWTRYVAHSIHDNRVPIKCAGVKCSELLPLSVLKCFIRQERVRRYEKQLSNRRLLQNDFFHCSRCDNFLFTTSTTPRILICDCGAAICRECREEAHEPLSCANMRKYVDMLKRNGQSFHESAVAHVASGVRCPRCAGLVDRTEGCNHMVCFCGHEFCFACGGPFTGSHYDCETEARRDYALIDGAETVHPTIFSKCSFIRRKKNPLVLSTMRTVLLRKVKDESEASSIVVKYKQVLDFIERAYVHLYLSYQRVHNQDFLAQQFSRLEDRLLFICRPFEDLDRIKLERIYGTLRSAVSTCDMMSSVCARMPKNRLAL